MSERNRTRRRVPMQDRTALPVQPGTQGIRQAQGMRAPQGIPGMGGGLPTAPWAGQPEGPQIPNPALEAEAGRLQAAARQTAMAGMNSAAQPDLQEMPFAVTDSPVPPPPVGDEHAFRTAEEADAFRLGQQMGSQSMAHSFVR